VKKLFIFVLITLISGCTHNNASKAFLYKKTKGTTEYTVVTQKSNITDTSFGVSSNPVYISRDSKFSIKLDSVFTGKLANKKSVSTPNYFSKSDKNRFNNIKDKELWLLTTISSLDSSDPLETNSKRYFKSTNVKFDSFSFSFFPLDSDESYVFTHESDMSYRVVFQIYEVDGFLFKSELSKLYNSPGIAGLVKDGYETLSSTFDSVVGNAFSNWLKGKSEEKLALERLLLKAGATQEFYGQFLVLRENNFFENVSSKNISFSNEKIETINTIISQLNPESEITTDQIKAVSTNYKNPFKSNSYVLYDHYKGYPNCAIDSGKRENEQQDCSISYEKLVTNPESGYIEFSIMESYSPKVILNNEGEIIRPSEYQDLLNISSNISKALEKLNQYPQLKIKAEGCSVTENEDGQLDPESQEKYSECVNLKDYVEYIESVIGNRDYKEYVNSLNEFTAKLGSIDVKEWKELYIRPSD
jgi:hypothetical protein